MSLSIAQLKSKWNKEKDSYRKQEIGSGVQKFVKELLASEEVFNLGGSLLGLVHSIDCIEQILDYGQKKDKEK